MQVDLGGLAKAWTAAIAAAVEAKSAFTKTGEICETFFVGAMDSMWDDNFRSRFLGGLPAPQFRLTLNKTFELASIVGPSLMWNNANRLISDYSKLEIDPTVFPALHGIDPASPQGMAMAQQFLLEQQNDRMIASAANALMERYLNYSQREQPRGGLIVDSRMAILDALIKGRGVIKVDTYTPYGCDYELTGGFRINVDDLLIDPDCTRGNLTDAKWIAIRHTERYWEVERRFKWPAGSLKGKGMTTSLMNAQNKRTNIRTGKHKQPKTTGDLVTWYEIFSLCGVGTRFSGAGGQEWHQAFEDTVKDEAYLCVCPGVNELLNLRNAEASQIDMDQLKPRLDWPIPYYRDAKWPVALLDFWDNTKSCWPIALVSAGLGQLVIMNVILCSIADRTYRDSLDKFAIAQHLDDDTRAKILSLRHEVMTLNPTQGEDISKLISFVTRPQMNFDVWRILDMMSMSFDKAVGLMELMYGLNPGGKVTRTAADANIKGEAVSVRPEFMATRVEEWHTNIANIERIAAGYSTAGRGLVGLLGKSGSMLWDELITKADPTVYMRDMRAMIEAGSTRRPNKTREAQNMQQVSSFLLPVAQWYAGTTGNTDPLNALVKDIGKSIEQPTEDWVFPSIQNQGPSPEEAQAQQELMAANLAKQKGSAQKLALNNLEKAHSLYSQGIGLTPDDMQSVEPADDSEFQQFL